MTHVGNIFIMTSILMGGIGLIRYSFDRDLAAFDVRLGITAALLVVGGTFIYIGG